MADETQKVRAARAERVIAIAAMVSLFWAGLASGGLARAQDASTPDDSSSSSGNAAEAESPSGETSAAEPADEQAQDEEAGDATDEAAASQPTPPQDQASALTPSQPSEPQSGAEQGEAAAEASQAQREPFPWRNSFFAWTHGVTPNSFVRGAQLSYNPMYYWWFSFTPRWYLDPQTFLFLSQGLYLELTDNDGDTAYNRDPQLTDTVIELRRTQPWEGFVFIPAARLTLPASKLSQAAERYFALGAGLTTVRVIPEAWALTIALIGRYQYWFAGANTPRTMGSFEAEGAPPALGPVVAQRGADGYADAPMLDQASGLSSIRHLVVLGLSLNVTPLAGLNVSLSGFYVAQEGHSLAPACVAVETSRDGGICFPDESATHWREGTAISLSVAYDVASWLNLALAYSNATVIAPLYNPDGSLRSPFNPDANFTLTATVQIDALYEAVAGGEDDGLTPEQRQRRRQGLAFVAPALPGGGTSGGGF